LLLSCAPSQGQHINPEYPPEDLEPADLGKEDGWTFNPEMLIQDHIFTDRLFMDAEDVQAFLEDNPYGRRSFLADYRWNNQTAAEWISQSAANHNLNPLVLLIRLQMEHSLIYKQDPSNFSLNTAMGCGCWDGDLGCVHGPHGFGLQTACAAEVLREHYDSQEAGGLTSTGWGVDVAKTTSDGTVVRPHNRATAVLYTYTPWVLEGAGGNWLFANLYRKYARHFLQAHPNHHWIGSDCSNVDACSYDDGVCAETGTGATFCTLECELYCPDSDSPFVSSTFCTGLDLGSTEGPQGWCVSQCDDDLYLDNQGCPDGFECQERARFNMPETTRDVCVPAE
jgi:hypothetical protein